MLTYILQRLLGALFVIFGVVSIVFLLIHLIPGDPVEIMLGESASTTDREALRVALGLNQPLWVQFQQYLAGLLQFDMGNSIHFRRPVSDLLLERLPATGLLAAMTLLITLVLALPLGIIAAVRRDTVWDSGAMTFSMLGVSIPNFWLGPILILVFSLWLGWFPVSGRNGFDSVVLPALTLSTGLIAVLSRMVRSSMLEVLGEDYMRTARAKGLASQQVILHHGLRNALLPVITLLGLQLGALLAGAVITETVFSWPGVGLLTIESIQSRDYPVVQACVLLISVTYVLVNLLTDLAYAWIDPRIRLGGRL
ncbi:MAG: ABC transporter permease [Gammaproteobacteria bacterium]|jgi:peptide/nickel transport system permease protein|nr:ABC transporter permease [Gammaproteobacteria bacterium]MDH3933579.1 ABC transporter permease [Gammaproteobacteria bacterium]MDH3987335.1 ABC transporter permease [Gammaproteobacteria bacterium]